MKWLHDQLYHFNVLNILAVLLIVAVSQIIEKAGTTKEIKEIAQEVYKNAEEIKDCIRDNRPDRTE